MEAYKTEDLTSALKLIGITAPMADLLFCCLPTGSAARTRATAVTAAATKYSRSYR